MCPKSKIIGKGSTVEDVICMAIKSTRKSEPLYQKGQMLCKTARQRGLCPTHEKGVTK
jgi:hypothetical protein